MASNVGAQTRGLSAADWTRLQRLRGARSYLDTVNSNRDVDVATVAQTPYNPALLISRHTGTSRIRRATSDWISYVGSQHADIILQKGTTYTDPITDEITILNGKKLTSTKLCNCTTSNVSIKNTGCTKCSVYVHKTMN